MREVEEKEKEAIVMQTDPHAIGAFNKLEKAGKKLVTSAWEIIQYAADHNVKSTAFEALLPDIPRITKQINSLTCSGTKLDDEKTRALCGRLYAFVLNVVHMMGVNVDNGAHDQIAHFFLKMKIEPLENRPEDVRNSICETLNAETIRSFEEICNSIHMKQVLIDNEKDKIQKLVEELEPAVIINLKKQGIRVWSKEEYNPLENGQACSLQAQLYILQEDLLKARKAVIEMFSKEGIRNIELILQMNSDPAGCSLEQRYEG